MILHGHSQHLSIAPFGALELPDFVVLIGPNGSGKSQLLEAIKNGGVTVEQDGQQGKSDDYLLMRPYEPFQGDVWQRIQHQDPQPPLSRPKFDQLKSEALAEQFSRLQHFLRAHHSIDLPAGWNNWHEGQSQFPQLDSYKNSQLQEIFAMVQVRLTQPKLTRFGSENEAFYQAMRHVAEISDKHPALIEYEDYFDYRNAYSVPAFQVNLARAIYTYEARRLTNDVARLRHAEEGKGEALTPEQFQTRFGLNPADELTTLMRAFGMRYEAIKPEPDLLSAASIMLRLRRDVDGIEINISGLSSGELVIFRFLAAMLLTDPRHQRVTYPSLLLLDEVDCALHPAMAKQWLEAVQTELVAKRHIRCIVATHSPTTVAVSPDGAIMEMRAGTSAPQPIEKQAAVNRLTAGIPTLAINFSGQRQVFTESDEDARLYTSLLLKVGSSLSLTRSLAFSSSGIKKRQQTHDLVGNSACSDMNTGCASVHKIVGFLTKAKVQSVRGVIDWDLQSVPAGDIHVVGFGTHYSIENLLYDPLLLAGLAIDQGMFKEPGHNLVRFGEYGSSELQRLADIISYDVLGFERDGSKAVSEYLGGLRLSVPEAMQRMKGHLLEENIVLPQMPWCKAQNIERKGLMQVIVDKVIDNYPKFCPVAFADLFRALAAD